MPLQHINFSIAIAVLLLSTACGQQNSAQEPPLVPNGDPVVVAAGDIACDPHSAKFNLGLFTDSCHMSATADLAESLDPTAVLAIGDDQYDCGNYEAYLESYDLSWGRLKAITYPALGNHEYLENEGDNQQVAPDCIETQNDATGYFEYFGTVAGDTTKGYYSYDLGAWHIVVLNSNCTHVGGCEAGSDQEQWLRADLAAHPTACTLAYWHHPLFSSGKYGNNEVVRPIWQALYEHGVEIVLNGHDHDYERFAPQDAAGNADPFGGIREFVVGTGGKSLHDLSGETIPNSEVLEWQTYGVLELVLHPTGYEWQFIAEGNRFFDSGSGNCH